MAEQSSQPAATPPPLKPNIDAEKGGRQRAPTVLQMEATECGAACLGMVLGHYGCFIPLEELRLECGVSRDGSKARNVLVAARKYGMQARGYRREPRRLFDLPFPMILFWNFNHFVVLEGVKDGKYFLNDPASGPRVVPASEFDYSFTGICLAFEPTAEFKPQGKPSSVYRGLWQRLGVSQLALLFVILATLFLVLPGLVIPVFSKIFIDDVLVRGSGDWVAPLLIGMALTAVLRGVLVWLQQYFLARLEIKLSITASTKFFWHVMKLPMEFFSQRYIGDINNRMALNDRVARVITSQLATNIINLITVVFYAIVLLLYDVFLTLVGVSLALLNLVVLKAVSRARQESNQRMLMEFGKIAGTSINGVQMIETLKSGGLENDFFSKWAGYQANALVAQHKLSLYSLMLNLVPTLLSSFTTIAILGLGGFRIIDGAITIGGLIAFQSLMASFSGPIEGLVSLGGELQTVKGDIARLDDVLKYKQDSRMVNADELPDQDGSPKLSGQVSVKGLTFGYSRLEDPLLEDLDLDIRPGRRIALVGGSGSGKSTIAKIICGLLKPWEGEVRFDGAKLDDIPLQVMANSVAFVDQEIVLFGASIRDNVTLWDPTINELDVTHALRDAAIDDVVNSRRGRLDTEVAEGGSDFSGGQRQRLEIARALSGNPSILVLDEATAALDPITEKQIDDHVRRRGCTCIIVAHRVSTIRDADEIVVLEKGKIVQRGIHEEMVNLDGPYRNLILAH